MPRPTLTDDGRSVTLDLHGATVAEAVRLARCTVQTAARRGRVQLKLIHGASTSDVRYRNRSIKHALYDLLDEKALAPHVREAWRFEGYLLLSLDVTGRSDPARLRLRDLQD